MNTLRLSACAMAALLAAANAALAAESAASRKVPAQGVEAMVLELSGADLPPKHGTGSAPKIKLGFHLPTDQPRAKALGLWV